MAIILLQRLLDKGIHFTRMTGQMHKFQMNLSLISLIQSKILGNVFPFIIEDFWN